MRRLVLFPLLLLLGSCAPRTLVLEAPGGEGSNDALGVGAPLEKLDYGRFQIWYDCQLGEPHRFTYTVGKDVGSLEANRNFRVDRSLPSDCKGQHSTASYRHSGDQFERGHLAPINHFDDSQQAMNASNLMTNIVPQLDSHNHPTWYVTEVLTECMRDINPVTVIGGVVFGRAPKDLENDHFGGSHGIATPEMFWKVLLTTDELGQPKIIAWWIPHQAGLGSNLDKYLRSVRDIEQLLGPREQPIDVPESLKDIRQVQTWKAPKGCGAG